MITFAREATFTRFHEDCDGPRLGSQFLLGDYQDAENEGKTLGVTEMSPQCFLRVNSRIASSSPARVSGNIEPPISSRIILVDCE
jgi:hypothetical protein